MYLSPDDQKTLGFKTSEYLSYKQTKNISSRKTIGYLFAIRYGAQRIWDTEGDNQLKDPKMLDALAHLSNSDRDVPLTTYNHRLSNPYPLFKPENAITGHPEEICWPRGFPLEYSKDKSTHARLPQDDEQDLVLA